MSATTGGSDKDYSPFKTFKMPGNIVNWGQSAGPAGVNTAAGDQKTVNSEPVFKGFPVDREDLSKAPGYRNGSSSNNQTVAAGQIQAAAAGNWNNKPAAAAGTSSNVPPAVDNNQLYQTQERCNSAPGKINIT